MIAHREGRALLPFFALAVSLLSGGAHASESADLGLSLSLFWITPFAAILLAIAILPLAAAHFWHPNRNKALVSAVLGLPVVALFATLDPGVLVHTAREFASFLTLLFALFVISGGISVDTDRQATPFTNTAFLALGSLLASLMGTTGAAMLLVRPLLTTNSQRTRKAHTLVFFTFLVANIGGALTPLGDPPLFMGYLKGVPFAWTFALLPEWAAMTGLLLAVYFALDTVLVAREPVQALERDRLEIRPTRVIGLWTNAPLLFLVILAVAFLNEQFLPFSAFPLREAVLLVLAGLSLWLTPRAARVANAFTFGPIVEVAVLFAGIFATMIPALLILNARGSELGVTSPAEFFWAAGGLSSFLDNTPTYVVFFALAESPALAHAGPTVAGVSEPILKAISLGAVFMGANTYIGNAPNFMIRSIAEERGVRMPSFFGYMGWSLTVLIPAFLALTWLFL